MFDYVEQYEQVAKDILKTIGAIIVCDIHEDRNWYTAGNYMDEQEVYAIATGELKRQYPDMNDFTLFHEKIKNILDDASIDDKCPFCEKAYNE